MLLHSPPTSANGVCFFILYEVYVFFFFFSYLFICFVCLFVVFGALTWFWLSTLLLSSFHFMLFRFVSFWFLRLTFFFFVLASSVFFLCSPRFASLFLKTLNFMFFFCILTDRGASSGVPGPAYPRSHPRHRRHRSGIDDRGSTRERYRQHAKTFGEQRQDVGNVNVSPPPLFFFK